MSEMPSSFTTLFGPIDHAEGSEARSVLSPIAYLVDLLMLTEDAGYHARRPDVRQILLDHASTFTEVPQLQIANEVMQKLATAGELASNFPAPLPFSEQALRLRVYAEKLGTTLDALQRMFRSGLDGHLSARLLLGLSQEELDLFATARDSDTTVLELWGVTATELGTLKQGNVELIKQKLQVSLKELKLLVRQDLSAGELNGQPDPEPEPGAQPDFPAVRFFINQGTDVIVLDETPEQPVLRLRNTSNNASNELTAAHLERMMRSVRLARRLELTFPELDWLLQTTCRQGQGASPITLDANGLQAIAIALGLRKLGELEVDELCSLWGAIKSHGRGDESVPADLFNRVVNAGFPIELKKWFEAGGVSADALDARLQAALRLSSVDYVYLKNALQLRDVPPPDVSSNYDVVVAYLTALRRIVTLASLLSLDVREMVALIDVLNAQWTVAEHRDLESPAPYSTASATLNPLARLVQPDAPPHQTLDVLQKFVQVKSWMDSRQLSPRQLAFICLADHAFARARLDDGTPIDDVQSDDEIEATLADLSPTLVDLLIAPSALQTGSLTASGAQAVFDSLRDARVLVTFGDPPRALLRVEPTAEELAAAMLLGVHERLELHSGDLSTLGFTDIDLLLSLLVSHGYLERVEQGSGAELEERHYVAPGLAPYFAALSSAATFTLPNFQARAEAVFLTLQQRVNAPSVEPAALTAAGVEAADLPALFSVLEARSYVVPVAGGSPTQYRVADTAKPFFEDGANLTRFVLPDFSASFAALAAKVEAYNRADANRASEADDLAKRLTAVSEQNTRVWLRTLSSFVSLSEDLTEIAVAWSFGTPNESLAQTLANAAEAVLRAQEHAQKPLSNAFLASRFCRLQQLSLLLRKTGMSAEEASVYLENQRLHRALAETLKLPAGFLDEGRIDALTTLPNGNVLIVSKLKHAIFDGSDYRLISTGTLGQIPGVTLTGSFETRVVNSGIDAAFSDTDAAGNPVLQLCAGDQYVTVSTSGTSAPKPITDWGRVRNNIQQNARVDAAVENQAGQLFLFSDDQYVRYDQPNLLLTGPAVVNERYPKSIRGKFQAEPVSPLPAAMFSKVDAAFRDGNDYYFFAGDHFTQSDSPYELRKIRSAWGRVLNYLFDEDRVDAGFVLGNATYLTRKNQLTRYTGSPYQNVDERFPITFGNISESDPQLRVLRRFPNGIEAALAGSDGQLYAFADGNFASSAAPDTSTPIRDFWGRVRNVFVDNQRVDGALYFNGALYLFCGDQYVRYSSSNYEFVDEGYPKRVHANWNTQEHIGQLPAGLPLPVTAVAVGRVPNGTTDDVYFFGGSQFAGPSGALEDIKAQWARVRNNIERTGLVDAALLDGSGRMYLFSGDQFYRYSSPDQPNVDETYPRRLTGNWAQEGTGYSLPDSFANGITAALRAPDARIFFFSGQSYARVDASPVATPRSNAQDWGLVRNWIQAQNRVGTAFVDPSGNTYLFGGDQFVRYSTTNYDYADEGYPLSIGTRWGNTPTAFRSDIDASLLFRSPVDNVQRLYIFKGDNYVRYSTSNYSQVDAGYPKRLRDGLSAEGSWFRGFALHELPPFPLPNDYIDTIEATYVDTYNNQPRITVFYTHSGATQWRREYRNGSWQWPAPMSSVNDYAPFTRLDAAFVSADGTLHAFSGDLYSTRPPAGGAMTTPVQIRTRWAKVRNQFADLGRVDATLNMGDGRTYLFCDTQYIKYSGALRPGDADFYVDEGYPKRISPNWPSESIAINLVPAFQASGYDLCRDAAGKIHFFNSTRYDFSGNPGSDVLLSSRWGKVENRFHTLDRVDGAYRAENGKLYLFCDTQYTRYSAALEPGSPDFYADEGYPKRMFAHWASEGLTPVMPNIWNALGSAVVRDAQDTYVFSAATFTSSQNAAATPVIPRWANVRNQLQTQNRVDAGFVYGQGANAVTLVFSGDQYVRYSGAYNTFVDEGYPKVIAHLGAAESGFPAIPSELYAGLRAFFAGTDTKLHVFTPPPADPALPQRYVSTASGSSLRPLNEVWGIVVNRLWDDEFVNAALLTPDGKLFLFSGDQYLRYSAADRTYVDESYPRKLSTSYAAELGVPALAPVLNQGVGAALIIGTTHFYFVGDQFVSSAQPTTARPLVEYWGLVQNHLQEAQRLDAAFVAPNGKLYLFAQNQYSIYSGSSRDYVDEEFPRVIATDIGAEWPQTPTDFRQDLTAAASFEGRSYLFKNGSPPNAWHVRFSDFRLRKPDSDYPIDNTDKFVERYDFELGKLPDWWRVKQLFDDYSGQTPTSLDYLDGLDFNDPKFYLPLTDPRVVALARATQWPVESIKSLLAIFVYQPTDLLDARTLVRLARCFELADLLGATPDKLYSEVWKNAFQEPLKLEAAADYLYSLIKAGTSTRDWTEVSRSLFDPVANAKRDALVACLIEKDPGGSDLRDPNDLYEHLLTDVQMDASLDTSKVVEAINSIQLFYHRALMRLETIDPVVHANLRNWWPWMKNYRIWEANRKVFLHPENYIRPELRTEKSPAFEALEEQLVQDEVTAISVRAGYRRYLESFHEISRLRIVGGYRYGYDEEQPPSNPNDPDSATKLKHRAVFMTGVSRTDPPVYYYRFGALPDTEEPVEPPPDAPPVELAPDAPIDWEPWQKVGITISAERVQPVYAFNRLFLFWIETKPYNATTFKPNTEVKADSEESKLVKLTLKYSFYDFTKEWVAPQAVLLNPSDPSDPEVLPFVFSAKEAEKVRVLANNPEPLGGGDEDFIYLSFRYQLSEWKLGRLTDGLDLVLERSQRWRFKGLNLIGDGETPFPSHLGIEPREVTSTVLWGEASDPENGDWFSFDAKGGTFLCRPSAKTKIEEGKILGQPFPKVTAAFSALNGDVFVFARDNGNHLYYQRYIPDPHPVPGADPGHWEAPVFASDPAWPWGRVAGVFRQDPSRRIQNVIIAPHTGIAYFLLGSHYFSYANAPYEITSQRFVDDLVPGAPTRNTLLGSDTVDLSWDDASASGRDLISAFKLPGEDKAVIVSREDFVPRGAATLDLDELRQASDSGGGSPFDGWDGLDTVFSLMMPEPSVVFSRGDQLVILTWSSKEWTTDTLGTQTGGPTSLSAAFRGSDDKHYFFAADQYTEFQPENLGGTYTFQSVEPRWGQFPSLFSSTLQSVDGAVLGPDDKPYLFSREYCLPFDQFDPDQLDKLLVYAANGSLLTGEPPKTDAIWKTSDGSNGAIRLVDFAFTNNGVVTLSGRGPLFTGPFGVGLGDVDVIARYSEADQTRPFRSDRDYPMRYLGELGTPPTGFYARSFAMHQLKFAITRLTSNTSENFSRVLFSDGIAGLLRLETQLKQELPFFNPVPQPPPVPPAEPARDELWVDTDYVTSYPGMDQDHDGLDLTSANAFYYWEIFFHIPFLIGQTLKQQQRFEEAMHWYEYVFDPTEKSFEDQYWKFLAFLENDTFNKDEDLSKLEPQLAAYRDDPFDPHAIAALRPMAYRKAFVMSYVDNLIAWGDMLFRQYTRESLGEATMLYVRAADILGKRPEELGKRALEPSGTYDDLVPPPAQFAITPEILQLENGVPPISDYVDTWPVPNDSIFNPYFYIPENPDFVGYWTRVEDRLNKIRHGLNIDGVKQSLALFAPPVDVMALVQAFASGGGIAQALADYNAPIPHYRFAFMLGRARELTARVTGLGSALLAALEKKDAEELGLLRNSQERQIMEMQLEVKQQQLESARQSLFALQEGLKNAEARESHYEQLLAAGLSAHEQTQIAQMFVGQSFAQTANVHSVAASVAGLVPQFGSVFALTYGGDQLSKGFQGLSQAFRAQAEKASFESSLAATLGSWERRSQDWELQKTLATGDTLQIGRQISAAEVQVEIANREVQIQRRQIKNNQSIDTFMNSKFTNRQLYQWMVGKLSGAYFQTYNLALQYAKAAQRAFQFELGLPESDVKYIGAGYWDSLRKGLLAGEQLQLDIDRLEHAHIEANARRLEITRHVSLLQVDPLALVRLKQRGWCEFELNESLFDGDFPGHYCRQIKTVSLSFPAVVGPYHNFNATWTQLGHRTLLSPDKKALNYLLGQGTEEPSPSALRVDWRPNQQVALSTGVSDTGLFQLNYSDDRYLPFEGTGAVSTWRLEINGVNGPLHRQTLSDVIVTVQYTARPGGSAFAEAVKKAVGKEPTERAWLLNLATDYSDAWQSFMNNPAAGLSFTVEQRNLPGASSKQITGIYLHYELVTDPEEDISRQGLKLAYGSSNIPLKANAFTGNLQAPLLEPGQTPTAANTWKLTPASPSANGKFNPRNVRSIALVCSYQSKPKF